MNNQKQQNRNDDFHIFLILSFFNIYKMHLVNHFNERQRYIKFEYFCRR